MWTAEFLEDLPSWRKPAPFKEPEHTFGRLEEAPKWLGGAEIRTSDIHLRAHSTQSRFSRLNTEGTFLPDSGLASVCDPEESLMKRVSALAFLFMCSVAYAQTAVTPAPATPPPAADGGGVSWLWIVILLAIVAAAIWYFTRKRGATTASGVAGVNQTTHGTRTTGTTTPPAGPNVYSSKDAKDTKR